MQEFDIAAARRYHRERAERERARREEERLIWLQRARQAVQELAPQHPEVQRVYLFGSLTQAGRFSRRSDIDIALVCDTLAAESAFWRALESALQRDVDVRPLTGAVAEAVAHTGELLYAR